MPKDEGNVKLNMKGRWEKVPFNKQGDPELKSLDEAKKIFTDDEILTLINKALYFSNYQREFHDRRRAEFKIFREQKAKEEARLRSRGLDGETDEPKGASDGKDR